MKKIILVTDFSGNQEPIEAFLVKENGPEALACTVKLTETSEPFEVFRHSVFPYGRKEELEGILQQRKALLKAYNDSMSLIYCLRNSITLKGE